MHFHGTDVRQKALTQLRNGARNADVARQLNVPLGTISYWKHTDRAKRGECPGRHDPRCTRCDGDLDGSAYAYLLGLYLGDGHIAQSRAMRSPSLSITCTESWLGLMDNCEATMRIVFPNNSVCRVRPKGCWDVKLYSKHLWCLFPQHGPGMKHTRRIALEPWQQAIVDEHPWQFVRGLIHSDGCRVTNWTTRVIAGERKRYEYPRYFFTNTSADIIRLFTDTLDRVGVEWKSLNQSRAAVTISVARKASVALMDLHVGPKY
ncbi:helix-turn-helix domain-containing protein [Streptomyces sp. Vc74B-19]|uniref:helix-turn-helix domain-containing protein n=1 Tax=Streptomyces sp. Vc74B-19 TaxID=2741324 RepID=UPI001BFC1151|nr:helix-turn-helix domain-containing protein [Streptomyces sp. Vc74B-19]MBT3163639.1 helix-turn-helix domain-containing protein [Streptomyces sp. Vc74B-19]